MHSLRAARALSTGRVNRKPKEETTLTINELVAEVTEINTANGWRERDMSPLSGDHPVAQITAMTEQACLMSEVIAEIRNGRVHADELFCRYRYHDNPFTLWRAGDKLVKILA